MGDAEYATVGGEAEKAVEGEGANAAAGEGSNAAQGNSNAVGLEYEANAACCGGAWEGIEAQSLRQDFWSGVVEGMGRTGRGTGAI